MTRGIAVRRAADNPNHFIMLGHTDTIDELTGSIFLMRTDGVGNPVWTNTYGRGPGRRYTVRSELRTVTNGYVVAGTVLSPAEGGTMGFILRVDSAGNMIWMRFYATAGVVSDSTMFNDIQVTPSGFVVTGSAPTTLPMGMFQNSNDTLILETDLGGNVVWAKHYPDEMGEDSGKSIAIDSQGYAVVGERPVFGFPSTQVLSVDFAGNVNWLRKIDFFIDGGSNTQNQESNGSLTVLPNGDYLFPGGDTAGSAALLQFNNAGTLVGVGAFNPGFSQQGSCAVVDAGGDIRLVGPISDGISNDYLALRAEPSLLTQCNDTILAPIVEMPTVSPVDVLYNVLDVPQMGPAILIDDPLVWDEEIYCESSPCLTAVPVECTVTGLAVTLSWPPLPATVAMAEVYRNGVLQAVVAGTSYNDPSPPFGVNNYELRLYDVDPMCPTASSFCSANVGISIPVIDITDVIAVPWTPVVDEPIICWNDHLVNLARNPRIAGDLDLIGPDLGSNGPQIPVVWLSLGQFPYSYTLSQAEAQRIVDFLAAGGSLYIEGGDVAFGVQNALTPLLGAMGIDGGAINDEVPGLIGLDSGLGLDASSLSAPYRGSGAGVDHLAPNANGAAPILMNAGGAGQTTGIYYDASVSGRGTHRVVTSSTLFRDYGGDTLNFVTQMLDGLSPMGVPDPQFIRGDSNGDSLVNIADPIFDLASLFTGGPVLCSDAQDFNDDGMVDIADPVASLSFIFSGGSAPPAPGVSCGIDPTADSLDCANPPAGCP